MSSKTMTAGQVHEYLVQHLEATSHIPLYALNIVFTLSTTVDSECPVGSSPCVDVTRKRLQATLQPSLNLGFLESLESKLKKLTNKQLFDFAVMNGWIDNDKEAEVKENAKHGPSWLLVSLKRKLSDPIIAIDYGMKHWSVKSA